MLFLLRYVPQQYLLQTCVLSWLVWLLLGSVFYSFNSDTYWTHGFYQAVNVGYSIGWGFPGDVSIVGIWFSIIYVMMGVVAISGIIGVFTDGVIEDRKCWVQKALQRKQESENDVTSAVTSITLDTIKNSFVENYQSFLFIIMWFMWVAVGVLWSLFTIEWNFSEAVYFSISSLSTGGLWPIPQDSSNGKYGFVAFFAAIGIPLMGKAMGDLATLFLSNSVEEQQHLQSINQPPSGEEKTFLHTLRASGGGFGSGSDEEDGDSMEVTSAEFVLLCLQRTKSVDPALINYICMTHKDMQQSSSPCSDTKPRLALRKDTAEDGGVNESGENETGGTLEMRVGTSAGGRREVV